MKKKILVSYSMTSTFTRTTLDYILAIKNFSDYEIQYIHVTNDARMDFDINEYDVVINNYCARFCFENYVSLDFERSLMNFRGLKIIAVQDDYDYTATLHRAIRRLGFHVLLTCIQREFWPLVHPRAELPGVHIIQGLTGYVPDDMIDSGRASPPLAERKTHVAYRGRNIGARYGRLGFEKYEIGRRMRELCETRGIPHDIAMDEESRVYGDAWFDFLGSSRTMLGSESGSNAFDFDGDLEAKIAAFEAEHGRKPTYHEFRDVLDPLEAPFNVGQISPRVFECAVMRTPMILFRGSYSGAIEPNVHYIPLEKDFSNADAILSRLGDLDYLQGFADRAYEHLVASGDYGYKAFARKLVETIEDQYPRWIDHDWLTYCRNTRPRGKTAELPDEADGEARIRASILREQPTDLPKKSKVFWQKQEKLIENISAYYEGKKVLIDGSTVELKKSRRYIQIKIPISSLAIRFFRSAWRFLPLPLRQNIKRICSIS